MSSPQPDLSYNLAAALLARINNRLIKAGQPPAKAFVYDGGTGPADDCCAGLLWVRVAQIDVTDGSGQPLPEIRNIPIGPMGYAITLEAGILRCAPTVNEQGQAPTAAQYEASAVQQASDRLQMRLAVQCDFIPDLQGDPETECDGQSVGSWVAIDAGACAGGYMTTRVGYSSTTVL